MTTEDAETVRVMTECRCDPGYGICMYSQDGTCLAFGGVPVEPEAGGSPLAPDKTEPAT